MRILNEHFISGISVKDIEPKAILYFLAVSFLNILFTILFQQNYASQMQTKHTYSSVIRDVKLQNVATRQKWSVCPRKFGMNGVFNKQLIVFCVFHFHLLSIWYFLFLHILLFFCRVCRVLLFVVIIHSHCCQNTLSKTEDRSIKYKMAFLYTGSSLCPKNG